MSKSNRPILPPESNGEVIRFKTEESLDLCQCMVDMTSAFGPPPRHGSTAEYWKRVAYEMSAYPWPQRSPGDYKRKFKEMLKQYVKMQGGVRHPYLAKVIFDFIQYHQLYERFMEPTDEDLPPGSYMGDLENHNVETQQHEENEHEANLLIGEEELLQPMQGSVGHSPISTPAPKKRKRYLAVESENHEEMDEEDHIPSKKVKREYDEVVHLRREVSSLREALDQLQKNYHGLHETVSTILSAVSKTHPELAVSLGEEEVHDLQ